MIIYEEIQSFFNDLNIEKSKSKISLTNEKSIEDSIMNDNIKQIFQKKVLKWFSKLNSEEKKRICTISNKYLTLIISQLCELYKKDNNIIFEPTEKMLILYKDYTSKTEIDDEVKNDEKYKISSNSLDLPKNNVFLSIEENISCNKKEYEENDNVSISEEEKADLYKKYFIIRNKIDMNKYENKIEIKNMQNDFLKHINIISSNDQNKVTLSYDLLSDFDQFKDFFLYFSDNNCFKECLFPKVKNELKYFSLPFWLSSKEKYCTLFQIIIAFYEQRILLFYEYYYYTNKIYNPINETNKIKEFYDEINTIIGQLNDNINYFDNLFNENIIKDLCNKNSINSELGLYIYHELKINLKDLNSGKEKITKLLKMITFLKVKNGKILFYGIYKDYIFDYLRDEIAKELINEDKKIQAIKKNKKNKHKNKKNKNKKEIIDDEKNNKEEGKMENDGEKDIRNENAKTQINNKGIKEI